MKTQIPHLSSEQLQSLKNDRTLLLRYVWEGKENKKQLRGCLIAYKPKTSDNAYYIGWSWCCRKDSFNKEIARGLAFERAKLSFKKAEPFHVSLFKDYWVKDNIPTGILKPLFLKFLPQAEKYFKTKYFKEEHYESLLASCAKKNDFPT